MAPQSSEYGTVEHYVRGRRLGISQARARIRNLTALYYAGSIIVPVLWFAGVLDGYKRSPADNPLVVWLPNVATKISDAITARLPLWHLIEYIAPAPHVDQANSPLALISWFAWIFCSASLLVWLRGYLSKLRNAADKTEEQLNHPSVEIARIQERRGAGMVISGNQNAVSSTTVTSIIENKPNDSLGIAFLIGTISGIAANIISKFFGM